jgi:uncharacterized protein
MEAYGFLDAALANILSPVVLCFALGCMATFLKSDLKIPDSIYSFLTIYLLFAIGLKGGVALSEHQSESLWLQILVALTIGVFTPFLSYFTARHVGKQSVANAAALAAHYGSVSVVTFISVQAFLQNLNVPFDSSVSTLVVIMECPAIIIALVLAKMFSQKSAAEVQNEKLRHVLHEILTGRSIFLLVGGMLVGFLGGKSGFAKVSPLYSELFQGVVSIFLLEMGIVASKRFKDLKKSGVFAVLFGILIPIANAAFAALISSFAGLSVGTSVILATLAASASYIAAPAAVRLALPEASPGIYLTCALTITFPFNLIFGIPLYFQFVQYLHRG